jgi:putative PIN family toxin of toxin-antitoxin system
MRVKKRSRVVIDTNIWISFLMGGSFSDLEDILLEKELVVLYSKELLNEIFEVVERPKFAGYFGRGSKKIIKEIFNDLGEEIVVASVTIECRDAKDNFILSLCKDGNADLLITSDKDLLIIKEFFDTYIITYNKLKELI